MTPKTLLARDPSLLSESEFATLVNDTARLGGWTLRYHTYRSTRSPAGFPDLVLVKPPRILFVELKAEAGKVSEAQQRWLEGLCELEGPTKGLVQAYVWRPSDWDAIVETLTGRRPSG